MLNTENTIQFCFDFEVVIQNYILTIGLCTCWGQGMNGPAETVEINYTQN